MAGWLADWLLSMTTAACRDTNQRVAWNIHATNTHTHRPTYLHWFSRWVGSLIAGFLIDQSIDRIWSFIRSLPFHPISYQSSWRRKTEWSRSKVPVGSNLFATGLSIIEPTNKSASQPAVVAWHAWRQEDQVMPNKQLYHWLLINIWLKIQPKNMVYC